MKILITGANGQIGKAIVQQLKEHPYEFLGLSHADLDITDQASINKILFDYRPALVINAAAYTSVDQAESDEAKAFAVNCQGVANLAATCAQLNAAIFHLSSDYVFSGINANPYNEDDPAEPINIYGKSKLAGEQVLATTHKYLVLRTAWVFSEHGNNFINRLLAIGETQSQLDIVQDQIGNPTFAGDVAAAIIKIIDRYKTQGELNWGIYHYAGHPGVSRLALAQYLFTQAQQLGLYNHPIPHLNPIASNNYPTPAKRALNVQLCCNKIQQEFGIMPSNWQAAIDQLLTSRKYHDCD